MLGQQLIDSQGLKVKLEGIRDCCPLKLYLPVTKITVSE